MRAQSSVKALSVVVVLALVSGCSPEEPEVVAVVPEPLAPTPEFEPGVRVDQLNPIRESAAGPGFEPRAVQQELNGIRDGPGTPGQVEVHRETSASLSDVVPQTPRRLVFECADGITFAVRMHDSWLALYPPGYPPNGSLSLPQVRSNSGVHYRVGDVDFRSKGDLATLEIGRERYVDCVANPAAAVWQETPLHNTAPR